MIDIIIPAYNSHDTINRTLLSIVYQKNSKDLNVIIINDGSTNDYLDEVEYFKQFINIREITLKENIGPGYARQYGLDHSKSKYVIFIDADDVFYSPLSVIELYKCIESKKADMVISDYIVQNNNNELKIYDNTLLGLHGKIYRRSFLKRNNIRFINIEGEEDTNFNYQCHLKDAKIRYLNITTYIYLYNGKSLTNKENYYKSNIEYYLKGINYLIKLDKTNKEKLKELCYRALLNAYFEDYIGNKLDDIYTCYCKLSSTDIDEEKIYKEFINNSSYDQIKKNITFISFLNMLGGRL